MEFENNFFVLRSVVPDKSNIRNFNSYGTIDITTKIFNFSFVIWPQHLHFDNNLDFLRCVAAGLYVIEQFYVNNLALGTNRSLISD